GVGPRMRYRGLTARSIASKGSPLLNEGTRSTNKAVEGLSGQETVARGVGVVMTSGLLARRKGSYGIDAPYLLPIPAALIVANVVQGAVTGTAGPFVAAAIVMACMGCGLYTSLRGKFVVWAEVLDGLGLRGDERVLDLGCGRGAVLLLAARRLTTGRAVGVDLWRKSDQSGNAAEATWRN